MSSSDDDQGFRDLGFVPRRRTMAYRRASIRPPVSEQIAGLRHDLGCHRSLIGRRNPHARGAALAMAYGALRLAVTPIGTEEDGQQREEILQSVIEELVGTGLDHVSDLIGAALACEADPGRLVPGAGGQQ